MLPHSGLICIYVFPPFSWYYVQHVATRNHPYVSFGIKQLDVLFLQLEPIAEAIGTWKLTLNHFRDLNPLHDVIDRRDYKEKYYESLMPLGLKYTEVSAMVSPATSNNPFVYY